ncbi:hypothetical protein M514_14032 [Trichuris suis]|uniref:Uncharacterized protein n=1 Tax=Trichuris suis TaxID=68888 RepID=A0A085N1A4_9BILA|nr:hypothetical protein M513_14032 [Trichuris suis]KFD63250.1 hypothetical protein M514_14032 [Trichuris suis]
MTYRCKTLKLFILDRISNESEKSISGSNNPHVLDAGISSSRSTKEKSSNGWSEECKRKLKCVKKKDHVIVSACVSRQAQHHRYMFQKRRNGFLQIGICNRCAYCSGKTFRSGNKRRWKFEAP